MRAAGKNSQFSIVIPLLTGKNREEEEVFGNLIP
jgi:hypothetical protein